jgi:hypothetical protein
MIVVSISDNVPTRMTWRKSSLSNVRSVGKFGSEQTVEVGDATIKGECGNCPFSGKAWHSYVWYGGVVVDGNVAYGFHVYIGVDRGMVNGNRGGAPW